MGTLQSPPLKTETFEVLIVLSTLIEFFFTESLFHLKKKKKEQNKITSDPKAERQSDFRSDTDFITDLGETITPI